MKKNKYYLTGIWYDENQKPFLKDKDTDIVIKSKDFENIRRLILYQNLVHYDDEYIKFYHL